jgi:hypothetical protein
MPRLVDLQRAFHALATGAGAEGWSAADLVRGDAVLPADARMEMYARMYLDRLVDVLGQDYPKLRAWLGAEAFREIAIEYVRAMPPRHPSLRDAGRRLSCYLADRADLPAWFSDLARLEWARVDVFDAEDAICLSRADLERLAPTDAPALHLQLVPASAFVPIASSVDELWAAIEDERDRPVPVPVGRTVLAWRRDLLVVHRTLDDDESALIPRLASGTTFADLCEDLAAIIGEDAAASRASTLVLRWAEAWVLRMPRSGGR